jgi:hypothetical protein
MYDVTNNSLTRAEQIQDQLLAFMDNHIYPNEQPYHNQLNGLDDRFTTVPLMETLKATARCSTATRRTPATWKCS